MLKLKPNCECCGVELAVASPDVRICTFECTFCTDCAETNFQSSCPNCTGNLVERPVRPAHHLEKHPASTERFVNPKHAHFANYASRGKAE